MKLKNLSPEKLKEYSMTIDRTMLNFSQTRRVYNLIVNH